MQADSLGVKKKLPNLVLNKKQLKALWNTEYDFKKGLFVGISPQ